MLGEVHGRLPDRQVLAPLPTSDPSLRGPDHHIQRVILGVADGGQPEHPLQVLRVERCPVKGGEQIGEGSGVFERECVLERDSGATVAAGSFVPSTRPAHPVTSVRLGDRRSRVAHPSQNGPVNEGVSAWTVISGVPVVAYATGGCSGAPTGSSSPRAQRPGATTRAGRRTRISHRRGPIRRTGLRTGKGTGRPIARARYRPAAVPDPHLRFGPGEVLGDQDVEPLAGSETGRRQARGRTRGSRSRSRPSHPRPARSGSRRAQRRRSCRAG